MSTAGSFTEFFTPVRRLWHHLGKRRKYQASLLLALMLLTSLAELLSIGSVIPFLGILTSPREVYEHEWMQPLVQFLGISEPSSLLLPLTALFCSLVVFAAATRLILLWSNTRLSHAIGTELSLDVYRKTLYQPYAVHVSRNTSQVINAITLKAQQMAITLIQPCVSLMSGIFILVFVLTAVVVLQPALALATLASFSSIYAVVTKLNRTRLLSNSRVIATESSQAIKILQEGLGGIRDILIDGSQESYCREYRKRLDSLRWRQAANFFASSSPRFYIEAIGIVFIATLAYFLVNRQGGLDSAVPLLGALVMSIQRLLPIFQTCYTSWSTMQGSLASHLDVLEMLDQPLPDHHEQDKLPPLPFAHEIEVRQLCFQFAENLPPALKDISIKVPRGTRLGIVGATGGGKSTLLDILMGLLAPTSGQVLVDGVEIDNRSRRAWQKQIAHVPQHIFLSDSSVAENIAFGIPESEIDMKEVVRAARLAQIEDTVLSLENGYDTVVGEKGVRLSGGERQRIGIARALYKQAEVLIFDEATSALDNETEQAVMESIKSLGESLTIILVAHRLNTLRNCSRVVELRNGSIVNDGTYSEVVAKLQEKKLQEKQ